MEITRKLISRNYTAGRSGKKIKRIVLHTYGGVGTSLFNWFSSVNAKASAHYAVFKSGVIEQYVKDADMAWHAGTKATTANPNNNLESIGIEHQDDGQSADSVRTEALYKSSAWLVAKLCKEHNIPCVLLTSGQKWGSGIVLHNYYSPKSCPGGLDANKIIKDALAILNPAPVPAPLPLPTAPAWKKHFVNKVEKWNPVNTYTLYNINDGTAFAKYQPDKKPSTDWAWEDWRMTNYSYSNNIARAFKRSELKAPDVVVTPDPVEPDPIVIEPEPVLPIVIEPTLPIIEKPVKELVDHKTVGDHLKAAAQFSAPSQAVATAFGVIWSYSFPDMPLEVVLAYTGLFGFAFNMAYVWVVKRIGE